MENKPQTPWYKKKGYIAGSIILLGVLSSTILASTPTQEATQSVTQKVVFPTAVGPQVKTTNTTYQTQTNNPSLSNDNYYTNTAGNTVHSPAYANSIPAGASAQCRDGTYSFSQSRRGTCSHHGGVNQWL